MSGSSCSGAWCRVFPRGVSLLWLYSGELDGAASGTKVLLRLRRVWDSAVFQARVVPFMHAWFPFMLTWWAVQWWHINGGLVCGRVGDR